MLEATFAVTLTYTPLFVQVFAHQLRHLIPLQCDAHIVGNLRRDERNATLIQMAESSSIMPARDSAAR